MLEGKIVNLRVMEREDLPLYAEWDSNLDFLGEYNPLYQRSKAEIEKEYNNRPPGQKVFMIEKKDGDSIGIIGHFLGAGKRMEIGFGMIPSERGKGYSTEAVEIMVDYLFLSQDIVRIQARTDPENIAAQKVLEKTGFKKEGTIRKSLFSRGGYRDMNLFSILREEWKEPKILTNTTSR